MAASYTEGTSMADASNGEGAKRTDRLSMVGLSSLAPDSLVGSFFHSDAKRGWQGAVVAEPHPGVYLVELFEWLAGSSTSQHLVRIEDMVGWQFYDTAEWMDSAYNHGGLERQWDILAAAQSADGGNAPFTPDERAEISIGVDQVKDTVRQENPELTAEQMATIEQALDEIKEATTRVGRKDLAMMINGAMFGLIVNGLVPPQVVQSIFHMLTTGIGHLFGIGGPPIIGP
jgi:hypothetical protein